MTQLGINIFGIFNFFEFFWCFWIFDKRKLKCGKINDWKIKIERVSNLNCLVKNINNPR